jgi:predicted MFS family arabinose efflux permease
VLWVGTLVNRLGLVVLPFLTLYLTEQRGLSPSGAALLVAGFGAGAFAANLVGGGLSDRIGRRATMLMSLVGGAVMLLLIPFTSGIAVLGITVVLLGLFGEMYRPAVSAAVTDLVPDERRARAFALLYWAINVGAAVAPALGGFLAERSYTALFVLDAATMLGYAGFIAFGIPETRPAEDDASEPGAPPARMRDALRDPALLAITGLTFLVSLAFFQAFTTLPLAMRADGLTAADYGFAIAANGALIVLLSLPIARWAEGRAPALVLAGAAVVIGVGYGLQAPAASVLAYAMAVSVWTFGEMAVAPVAPAVVARLAPVRLRGGYQGAYGASWGLAALVGPALGGFVYDAAGPTVLWTACLGVGIVAAVGFLVLHQRFHERLAEPLPS